MEREPACRPRRRAAGARVRGARAGRWPSSAARRWRIPTACSGARRQRAERARRQRRRARRRVVHAARRAATPHARSRGMGSAAPKVLLIDEANPVFGSPSAWKVGRRAEARAVHRELRLVHRRNQRARGSDPAGSLVPRIVGRRGAREPVPRTRSPVEVRTGDEAALRHALDARRLARRVAQAAKPVTRAELEYLRRV